MAVARFLAKFYFYSLTLIQSGWGGLLDSSHEKPGISKRTIFFTFRSQYQKIPSNSISSYRKTPGPVVIKIKFYPDKYPD